MAKTRKTASSTQIIRAFPIPRQSAPIIKVSAPRAIAAKKKPHRRRSSSVGGAMSGKSLIATAIGGAAFGFIEKSFPELPTLPLVGRAGTIAIAAYFLSKRGGLGGGIVRDIANAGAAIAGYQLGKTGSIAGDVMGDVDGLAAQV